MVDTPAASLPVWLEPRRDARDRAADSGTRGPAVGHGRAARRQRAGGALGGGGDDEGEAAVVGTRLDVAVPAILRRFGADDSPAEVERTATWLLARIVELYGRPLPVRPGVTALLTAAKGAGLPQALVSSSYRVQAAAVLAHLPRWAGRPSP